MPTSPVKASIIIVNWNGKEHLPECLESLKDQTFKDFETILVDNGSVDGSLEFVAAHYPWVRTVPLPVNRGFAGGNNAGLPPAVGEYIITLNNDTKTDPGWLEELVRVADENPDVGMVACRICSYDDHDLIDSLGVKVCHDGMSRGAYRLQRFSELTLDRTEEILIPSACAALYRRRMIDAIGFFDDSFFAYCEDTDLGLRGRLAGWKALLARDAVIYHKYSRTGGAFSPFKLYLVERNHYWAALKSFPVGMLLALPFWTMVRYLVQAQLVLRSKGAGAQFHTASPLALIRALARGIWDAVTSLPYLIRKRRMVMAASRLSPGEMKGLLNLFSMSFTELLDAG